MQIWDESNDSKKFDVNKEQILEIAEEENNDLDNQNIESEKIFNNINDIRKTLEIFLERVEQKTGGKKYNEKTGLIEEISSSENSTKSIRIDQKFNQQSSTFSNDKEEY